MIRDEYRARSHNNWMKSLGILWQLNRKAHSHLIDLGMEFLLGSIVEEEKCRHTSGDYSKEVVHRFEKILLEIDSVNQEIVMYLEKKDIKKRIWILQQQLEIEKAFPLKTNLMVGRTKIPKWSGQSYDIWKMKLKG